MPSAIPSSRVQVLDERALEVRLEEPRLEAQLVREAADLLLQAVQRQLAVVRRIAAPELVEVHAVKHLDAVAGEHRARVFQVARPAVPMRERWALVAPSPASGAALAAALIGACALIALGVSSMGDYAHELAAAAPRPARRDTPQLRRAGADLRRERLAAPAVRLARPTRSAPATSASIAPACSPACCRSRR